MRLRAFKASLLEIVFMMAACTAHAQSELGKGIQFVTGAYMGLYIHEAGHALAAKAMGATDVEIVIPKPDGGIYSGEMRPTFPKALTSEQNQLLSVSGLVAQNLATEFILQNKSLTKSAVAQGVAGGSMMINVANVFRYYTRRVGENGYQGNDIDKYAQSGGNPHVFSALLLTYTAYSLQRMRQKEIPLFGVSLKF